MATPALHYHLAGSDHHPVVLLLHGFMGSSADWIDVMTSLADRYRCLAVDLPGHGGSVGLDAANYTMEGTAQVLLALLDELAIEQCRIVGYSMGGRLALYVALNFPKRCTKLVLESASPGLASEAERAARRASDEARAVRLETGDFDAYLHDWYGQALFSSLDRHPDLRQRMIATRQRNDPRELARSLRGIGTGWQPSLWERLPALQVSTCVVAGALDAAYAEMARRMAKQAAGVQAAIVPEAGHAVHAEQPGAFLDLLNTCLA